MINYCSSNPCSNGGTCSVATNFAGYSCKCPTQFTGQTCNNILNPCISSPCQYGVCNQVGSSYTCSCNSGYTGSTCNRIIDVCLSNPCNIGTCESKLNYWYCVCPIGYTGLKCETPLNSCDLYKPACLNQGTCVNQPSTNSFTCICPPSYTWYRCETDYCSIRPCINGICSKTATGYQCQCNRGFTGTNCEIAINLCSPTTCQNQGLCIQNILNQTTSCLCMAGFTGNRCQNKINNCFNNPCSNSATCIPTSSSFTLVTYVSLDHLLVIAIHV